MQLIDQRRLIRLPATYMSTISVEAQLYLFPGPIAGQALHRFMAGCYLASSAA